MENTTKSSAIKLGATAGVILLLLYTVFYVVHLEMLASFWFGIIILFALMGLGFYSIAKTRGTQKGFISFKEAFSAYFIPVAIGLLIPTLFLYLLFNFIDVEAAETLKDISIEKSREIMAKFGAPESQIEEAILQAEQQDSYSLQNIFIQYAGTLVFAGVIGLIGALTMKKKNDLG